MFADPSYFHEVCCALSGRVSVKYVPGGHSIVVHGSHSCHVFPFGIKVLRNCVEPKCGMDLILLLWVESVDKWVFSSMIEMLLLLLLLAILNCDL